MVEDLRLRIQTEWLHDPAPAPEWRISPLELLHPDGVARRAMVIGGNCPAALRPGADTGPGQRADLVVLAPALAECRQARWLDRAVGALAHVLDEDGLAYVLAPRRWRPSICGRLRAHGLAIEQSVLHFPNWSPPRHQVIVPLAPLPAGYAFEHLVALPAARRWLATAACHTAVGRRLLGGLMPAAAIVARRPGARPLFGWLGGPGGLPAGAASAIVSTRWYGPDGTAIAHGFAHADRAPAAIFKLGLTPAMVTSRVAEAALLRRLGPAARHAGARVPEVALVAAPGGLPVLRQSVVAGQSAAGWLAARPHDLAPLMARIADWLIRWNAATARSMPLAYERLRDGVLAPARLLAPRLPDGLAYLAWLEGRCAALAGMPAPLVASHNDLTMWNILLDAHGGLGIVDWELARQTDLPLNDFYYAMADAAAAASSYRDRPAAFARCLPGGDCAALVAGLGSQLRGALALPGELAVLCFHAGWLRHAANEHAKKRLGEPRPTLEILAMLARRRHELEQWVST